MLILENIAISYGPCEVLSDISFRLAVGEIVILLGPNGAGKTSLIKALNRTVGLSSGSITLDGTSITEHSRRQIARRIAVVAQENETKFPVTVLDFVLAGRFANGSAFGWETPEDIAVASKVLAECDLEEYGSRLMNELSGGERQRVVLARAMATEAKILLLDEPTANLDLAHQALMFRLVRDRCRSAGYSSVVITHDLNLAAEFADQILMLNKGRVFAFGTPAEVLTEANIKEVYGVRALRDLNPASGNIRVTTIY